MRYFDIGAVIPVTTEPRAVWESRRDSYVVADNQPPLADLIRIEADSGNTGTLSVGHRLTTATAGSRTGYRLDAGEAIELVAADMESLYVASDTAGDAWHGVQWVADDDRDRRLTGLTHGGLPGALVGPGNIEYYDIGGTIPVVGEPRAVWETRIDDYAEYESQRPWADLVRIESDAANAGVLSIGFRETSAVTGSRTGYILDAGEFVELPAVCLQKLYIASDTAGDAWHGVQWVVDGEFGHQLVESRVWLSKALMSNAPTAAFPARPLILMAAGAQGTATDGAGDATNQLSEKFEAPTNDVNYPYMATALNKTMTWAVDMPGDWDGGTMTAVVKWTTAAASGNVKWEVSGRGFQDSSATDQAMGTAQNVQDAVITAEDVHVTSATSAITFAGTPSGGDYCIIECKRIAASASEMTGDAKFLSLKLSYTTDQHGE